MMGRRGFLRFLGLAPVAAGAGVVAAKVPDAMPPVEVINKSASQPLSQWPTTGYANCGAHTHTLYTAANTCHTHTFNTPCHMHCVSATHVGCHHG